MFSKGEILLSEPFLPDPNFKRSVILLAEHGEGGSLGFVLNNKSTMVLEDLGEEFRNIDLPVYIGGPVEQNTLHFVHTLGNKIDQTVPISDVVYWSGNLKDTLNLIRLGIIKETDIRFFLGYSGWGKGQLQSEYNQKSWFQIKNIKKDIFEIDPQNLWRQVLKNQGGEFKQYANYPLDPRLN